MARKRVIFTLVFAIAFAAVSSVFFYSKHLKKVNNAAQAPANIDWPKEKYSRISFFNASKDRASINMPEIWEGKYRIKEEGDIVKFLYLHSDGKTEQMFAIKKKKPAEQNDEIVCKKGGLDFVLVDYGFKAGEDMRNYKEAMDFLLKSLKCG